MKMKVNVVLKSGKEIKFECDSLTTSADHKTGILSTYEATGVSRNTLDGLPAYINPNEVAAITVLDYNVPIPQETAPVAESEGEE